VPLIAMRDQLGMVYLRLTIQVPEGLAYIESLNRDTQIDLGHNCPIYSSIRMYQSEENINVIIVKVIPVEHTQNELM
jgi:hypothetical protein